MSEAAPVFAIEKLYLKDLSVEVPGGPDVFLERETPNIEINIATSGGPLQQEGFFEVVVTATITARTEDKAIFLIEVAQAGVFQIRNIPPQDMEPLLGIGCPNTLFPYLREAVSSVATRAGFPPVILAPMNFEALFMQAQQQQGQQQQAS